MKAILVISSLSPACLPVGAAHARPIESAGDNHAHDLVGAFENLMHAQIAHDLLEAVIGEIAVAAVHLQRLVGDIEAGVGDEALGHGAEPRRVRRFGVERRGGAPQKSAADFELGRHVGEAKLQRLKFERAFVRRPCARRI